MTGDPRKSTNTKLQIDGDIHPHVTIDWDDLIEVKGNVDIESHLTSTYDSIIAKNIAANCILNANKYITVADVKNNCGSSLLSFGLWGLFTKLTVIHIDAKSALIYQTIGVILMVLSH